MSVFLGCIQRAFVTHFFEIDGKTQKLDTREKEQLTTTATENMIPSFNLPPSSWMHIRKRIRISTGIGTSLDPMSQVAVS